MLACSAGNGSPESSVPHSMKYSLPTIFIFLIFTACHQDEMTRPSVFSDILFTVGEQYPNQGVSFPQLSLSINTKEIFNCINYGLSITQKFEDEILTVEFKEIIQPDICLTALGPATITIPIDESTKKLVLTNGEITDQYDLFITSEQVTIKVIESFFSMPVYTVYNRYPVNSFVCVCGTLEEYAEICSDFIDLLAQKEVVQFHFPEGVNPYADSSSGHHIDLPARYFLYVDEATFQALDRLLTTFSNDRIPANSGISIYMRNWENQQFSSWN